MKPRLSRTCVVVATLLSGSFAVRAADLSAPPPAYVAPSFGWTGCYIGGNAGGAWANVDVTDVNTGATASPKNNGFAGGVQIGCDYQVEQWVVGIRNIFDGTSISNGATFSDPTVGFTGTINSKLHWFDALTARAGYLVGPNVLLYAQGGAAWTSWDVNAIDLTTGAQIGNMISGRNGWTVGGGVEWMFLPHWSTFLEYNFVGFGSQSETTTVCALGTCANISSKSDLQNVLVGLNYKF